jgi:hypothetical protein
MKTRFQISTKRSSSVSGVLPRPEQDSLRRHADAVAPQGVGLLVRLETLRTTEHRDPEPLRRNCVHPGHQLPGVLDRFLLEIVAEGEVAQHLEEGLVPRRAPDHLQVVVLARHAQALL